MRIDTVGLRAQSDRPRPHRRNPGRRSRDRSRRFAPGLDASLESRALLSAPAAGSRSAIAASAFNPEVSLPHQEAGTTFDMLVPGPRLGSTHELTVGPDGNLWFTQQLQDRVGRLTLDGRFTFFPTGANSGPHGIQFDKQGRLWITRQFSNTISQLDLHGRIIANHVIPYRDSSPHGLTVARDGKVWFTGREGNVVGYYNPRTNRFRVYPLPDLNPNPNPAMNGNFPIYINEAPDGSMYFTDLLTSRVSRITPSGKLSEYLLPSTFGKTNNARPIAVYVRKDGVAVVSEESGHAYGYLLKDGTVEELPLTPKGSEAAALTYDRLGTLWVQYNTPDLIARINPDGSITTFPIPTGDAVQHRITIGPDGELWYTELKADRIGRMITGHADGPALDGVAGQRYDGVKNGSSGLDDRAVFLQGKNQYDDRYTLKVRGNGSAADRRSSIVDFIRNLQGNVNRLTRSAGKPTFGLQQPIIRGPGLRSSFQVKNGLITFSQRQRLGPAVYLHSFTMKLRHDGIATGKTTNLSSATAHFLEAVEVESGGGGII